MNANDSGLPALLGGHPIRPDGPPLWPRSDEAVQSVLRTMAHSGEWGRYHGPHVPELCRRLEEYHRVEHALVCSSGTAAVELALRGVGVQEGDEVVLSAYDFKANFQNVLVLKALPVLIDIDPVTWQLDPSRIEASLTPKTRAILISHLHGGAVPTQQVRQIADARGIALVEDACQNPGALLNGRRAGTWGDVGVLSFGGSKLLTSGRGGAILTSRPEIAERIKRHLMRGNDAYPLSEIQAAILRPQLDQLDIHNDCRLKSVVRLCQLLRDFNVNGLKPLQLPTPEIRPAYYKVGFQFDPQEFQGLPRKTFIDAIQAEGIAADAGFRSLNVIHGSRRFRAADELVSATQADLGIVTLHHPVLLENESAIEEIVRAVIRVRDFAIDLLGSVK